jgi:hypothetical protein
MIQEGRWPVSEGHGFTEEPDPLVEVVPHASITLRLTQLWPLGASGVSMSTMLLCR